MTATTHLFCVRATYGTYTKHFVEGGYVGIGWFPDQDLGTVTTRDELYSLYKAAYPKDTSNLVIGQNAGQIARFLLEIKAGDHTSSRRRPTPSGCTTAPSRPIRPTSSPGRPTAARTATAGA